MTSQSPKRQPRKSESMAGKVRSALIKLEMDSAAKDLEKDGASYRIKREKIDGIQQWKRKSKEEKRKSRGG